MDFMVLFDKKFMVEGLVCVASILDHGPTSRVFVLCLDKEVERVVPRVLADERVVRIRREELEERYPAIAATKASRPWAPYTQSLKPFLPEYIFDTFGAEALGYVDSDVLFWGDCGEIDREMGSGSFMVTSREQEPPPPCGSFNGGCFSCRNDPDCRAFLKWWQERCVEWCLWQAGPGGAFGEEGYLNIFRTEPQRFSGIRISRHPGINLAPWNMRKHRLEHTAAGFVVDNRFPLVCYHYQGFGGNRQPTHTPTDVTMQEMTTLYMPYGNRLSAMAKLVAARVAGAVPECSACWSAGDVRLTPAAITEIPQEVLSEALADPMFSHNVLADLQYLLITHAGMAVGFLIPCERDEVRAPLVYIGRAHRNAGIGRRAVRAFLAGKAGMVGIDTRNMVAKRMFAAAGFSAEKGFVPCGDGQLMEIWTTRKKTDGTEGAR